MLALPGLGLIGLSVIRAWRRRAAPAGMYAGAHSEMAGLPGPGQTPEPVDRVLDWLQAQVSVQPVADLIRAADPRTQRWGVGLLAKRGDGAAVELLREALRADDRDTQIAASGALQRVEERLAARIALAQEQLQLDPESPERLMAVGDACVALPGEPAAGGGDGPPLARRGGGRVPGGPRAPAGVGRAGPRRWPGCGWRRERWRRRRRSPRRPAPPRRPPRRTCCSRRSSSRRAGWSDLRALSRDAVAAGRADEHSAGGRGARGVTATPTAPADVCLILEGTYPYVTGGVSAWIHQLVNALPELRFAIFHISATSGEAHEPRYTMPPNVVSLVDVGIHGGDEPEGTSHAMDPRLVGDDPPLPRGAQGRPGRRARRSPHADLAAPGRRSVGP